MVLTKSKGPRVQPREQPFSFPFIYFTFGQAEKKHTTFSSDSASRVTASTSVLGTIQASSFSIFAFTQILYNTAASLTDDVEMTTVSTTSNMCSNLAQCVLGFVCFFHTLL